MVPMRIKELREAAGLFQSQLAEATGVVQSAVAKWEAGKAYPSADKLPLLAAVLRCSISDLYAPPSNVIPAS